MTISTAAQPVSFPSSSFSSRRRDPWTWGEPTLAEVMDDPIVHLLMRRDGLTPAEVRPLFDAVSLHLRRSGCRLTARAA